MKRQHPLISPLGCLAALALVAFLIASAVLSGGALFSPGPVSASAPSGSAPGGYTSHADFENECELCHAPWRGASDVRCLACHSEITDQIDAGSGLHTRIPAGHTCESCHGEHQGRSYTSLFDAAARFDHNWTGFNLSSHRLGYDGSVMACATCHGAGYTFAVDTCARCHSEADPIFMSAHVSEMGVQCLACHTGSGDMAAFDHSFFPLVDGHAEVACADCHGEQISTISAACETCHDEPDIHRGQFGTDCAACHTITGWHDVTLTSHSFPLDHAQQRGVNIPCLTCHPTNYVIYTCYSSGCHAQAETESEHIEEGISNFADCMACHPDGREHEDG
jgi:hypothetical protein